MLPGNNTQDNTQKAVSEQTEVRQLCKFMTIKYLLQTHGVPSFIYSCHKLKQPKIISQSFYPQQLTVVKTEGTRDTSRWQKPHTLLKQTFWSYGGKLQHLGQSVPVKFWWVKLWVACLENTVMPPFSALLHSSANQNSFIISVFGNYAGPLSWDWPSLNSWYIFPPNVFLESEVEFVL